MTTENFKVKLVSAVDTKTFNNIDSIKIVTFDVTPQIQESGSVDYDSIKIIHTPTTFQSYKNTPSRTFSISDVKLISRTPSEARDNIYKLNVLRGWRMPYFGKTEITDAEINLFFSQTTSGQAKYNPLLRLQEDASTLKKRHGAPPEILYFSAYTQNTGTNTSSQTNRYRGNINRVPVVLTSLSITYPDNVAYIPTAKRGRVDALGGVPFPTIMNISIDLVETHSPHEINNFNLAKYYSGILEGF